MQPNPLKPNCVFCGNWFSNYESIVTHEVLKDEVDENESNIYGEN